MPSVLMNIARSCLSVLVILRMWRSIFRPSISHFQTKTLETSTKTRMQTSCQACSRRKNLDFMRFESFPLEILSQNFPHCSHTEVQSVGSFSHMTSIIFREKVFHSLHCFHGKRFFSFCLSGVNGTVIFQSLHHSGERLCM